MFKFTFISLICAAFLISCSHSEKQSSETNKASKAGAASEKSLFAKIKPKSGNTTLGGAAKIVQRNEHLMLVAKITGLTPNTTHGFHIHEKGDCSANDASSAGGHYAPAGNKHGAYEDSSRHAGDLGNIKSNAQGVAVIKRKLIGLNMKKNDQYSVNGRAIIVHEKADDLESQPSGAAGSRIGCGVLKFLK